MLESTHQIKSLFLAFIVFFFCWFWQFQTLLKSNHFVYKFWSAFEVGSSKFSYFLPVNFRVRLKQEFRSTIWIWELLIWKFTRNIYFLSKINVLYKQVFGNLHLITKFKALNLYVSHSIFYFLTCGILQYHILFFVIFSNCVFIQHLVRFCIFSICREYKSLFFRCTLLLAVIVIEIIWFKFSLLFLMCLNCKCTILSSSIKDYRFHRDENSKQVLER